MKISYLLLTMQIFLRWLKWKDRTFHEVLYLHSEGLKELRVLASSNIPLLLNPLKRETSLSLHNDVRSLHHYDEIDALLKSDVSVVWDFEVKPQRLHRTFTCPNSWVGTLQTNPPKSRLFEASKRLHFDPKRVKKRPFLRPKMTLKNP